MANIDRLIAGYPIDKNRKDNTYHPAFENGADGQETAVYALNLADIRVDQDALVLSVVLNLGGGEPERHIEHVVFEPDNMAALDPALLEARIRQKFNDLLEVVEFPRSKRYFLAAMERLCARCCRSFS